MGVAVESIFFTLEIEHNGLFCGPSNNLEYYGATLEILDYCSAANLSYSVLQEYLKWLGYGVDEQNMYWCRPGHELSDGLVHIRGDADVQDMIKVGADHKVLHMLVDHSNFIQICRDDVIYKGSPTLAVVSSPTKMPSRAVCEAQVLNEDPISEMAPKANNANEDGNEEAELADTDTDFSDSDYEIDEGDDDFFDDNIDFDVHEEEEVEEPDVEPEYVLDDEDLHLTKEEEYFNYKFRAFNAKIDMKSPIFKVGMVFADVKELRNALTAYSIRQRVKIRKVKNEPSRLDAVCQKGCPWMLKAGKDNRTGFFFIKAYAAEHRCPKKWKLRSLTSKFLTAYFIDEFRDDQKMSLGTFSRKVTKEFNVTPNRWKLARARKQALKEIHGDEESNSTNYGTMEVN